MTTDLRDHVRRAIDEARAWGNSSAPFSQEEESVCGHLARGSSMFGFACGLLSREEEVEKLKARVAELERKP